MSGFAIGRILHKTSSAGIEIGANTIARGEFSIALAAIPDSAIVSTPVTLMVIVTSIVGSITGKSLYHVLKRGVFRTAEFLR